MQFPARLVTMTFCLPYGDPDKLLTLEGPFLCAFFGLPKLTNILCMVKHTKKKILCFRFYVNNHLVN